MSSFNQVASKRALKRCYEKYEHTLTRSIYLETKKWKRTYILEKDINEVGVGFAISEIEIYDRVIEVCSLLNLYKYFFEIYAILKALFSISKIRVFERIVMVCDISKSPIWGFDRESCEVRSLIEIRLHAKKKYYSFFLEV